MRYYQYLTLMLAVLSLTWGFAQAENPYLLTPANEVKGRLVVEIDPTLGPIQVKNQDGIVQIGNPALDALARQYHVYSLARAFPGARIPINPEIQDMTHYYLLEFPVEMDLHAALADFRSASSILDAQVDRAIKLDYTPNDTYFPNQWGLSTVQAPVAFDYYMGSPTVKVCIVDSGIDTAHVDLRNNLWINPGEDLNHNGIIEMIEWNGIDNDANGYTDDFYGWNFYNNNNNVQDLPVSQGGGHGTHCAGDASAVTDNGLGVASLGCKAKIITSRAGLGGTVLLTAAANGIYYAANMGADVINLSFGSDFTEPFLPPAINNAWSQGAIICGAAGNNGVSTPHYPGAYANTVAVAATAPGDNLATFSNYGTWVDLCAPGQSIINTVPGNSYESWDGTSFSSPLTVGLCALVWGCKPTWTNQQVITHVQTTCTNINSQNPQYIGLMGSGRINAGQAISVLFPHLSYTEQVFNDTLGGNGDLRPDPGETVRLWLTMSNTSTTVAATGVTVTATCSDPSITITQASSTLGNIPIGSSANNHLSPIMFTVSSTSTPHEATFTLSMHETGMNFTQVATITQMIGRPPIVIVDDDGGSNFQIWYDMDLDSLNQIHDIWNVTTAGSIPTTTLQLYSLAIWHTSNAANPLTAGEQTTITSYLSNGGHLFLVGENIDEQMAGQPFYANTLHATSLATAGSFQLTGVAGDTISNGTSLFLAGGTGAGNSLSPNCISPTGGAVAVYTYNVNSLGGGLRWNSGVNKLVYFAFNFEATSGLAGTTLRRTVLNNIITWLGVSSPPPPPPALDVTLTPVNPPITIPANGGSFQFNAAVQRTTGPQAVFWAWARMKYPNGTYSGPTLGPVQINPPVGVTITRLRNQNIASTHPAGVTTYLGYANTTFTYPAIDSSSFTFTKLVISNNGPWVNDYSCSGEPFPGEVMPIAPVSFALIEANPNPFNPVTTLSFTLPEASLVVLNVYDIQGRLVITLVNGLREAGQHQVTFDGSTLASGVYLYALEAGTNSATGKMVLMK
jgi:hypothetical protein